MNHIFMIQFAQIIFFSTLFCVFQAIFISKNSGLDYLYEGIEDTDLWNLGIFMSFWLIMIRYIPFDVIMQTETGKIIYSKIMEWDLEMTHFDSEQDQYISCNVQSMQLPEALGEVDHIFCDKTGTLTLNDLDVR